MNTLVSFIVPVYNIEEYVEECLASLASQKLHNMEVIVVDDGSTDHSRTICERFAEKDSRFRVLHKENGGQASARNLGLKHALGEWICFVDGDDLVVENSLDKIQWQTYRDSDIVYFRYSHIYTSGKKQIQANDNFRGALKESSRIEMIHGLLDFDYIKRSDLIPNNISIVHPWAKLFRREYLVRNNLSFQERFKRFGEDICFNLSAFQCFPRLYIDNINLYIYRYRESSSLHGYNVDISNLVSATYDFILSVLNNDPNSQKEFEKDLYIRAIRDFLFCCTMDFFHSQNPKSKKQRKKEFLALRNQEKFDDAFHKGDYRNLRLTVRIGALICKYKLFSIYGLSWKFANHFGINRL